MQWRSPSSACLGSLRARTVFAALVPRRYVYNTSSSSFRCNNIASALELAQKGSSQASWDLEVVGHVRTVRNQKRRSFVEIGDGSTTASLQALLDPAQATGLSTGTAVKIFGLWQPCPSGKQQSHELHARSVEILGSADAELYPLQKKYHSNEFLRSIPHLRLRVPFNALLARLRSECEYHISNYFRTQNFVRTHPPIITSSDCEGAGDVFTLSRRPDRPRGPEAQDVSGSAEQSPFFKEQKYLTVSSQLHLEAYIHEHPRVWTLSPTFRAEKSDTPRHLSEFYMLEAEERADTLEQIMDTVESLVRYVAMNIEKSSVGGELVELESGAEKPSDTESTRPEIFKRRLEGLKRHYWPRITYSSAIDMLHSANESNDVKFQYNPDWHSGLHLEHERFIATEIGRGSPVFVTDYPQAVKPFYMLPSQTEDNGHGPTVACFDLLFPDVCEVVGGSLREHRLEKLEDSMIRHGLLREDGTALNQTNNLDWYLDLRRYGSVPHGGFGLGFDRLLSYLAGVESIRDVVPWPRYYGRCDG